MYNTDKIGQNIRKTLKDYGSELSILYPKYLPPKLDRMSKFLNSSTPFYPLLFLKLERYGITKGKTQINIAFNFNEELNKFMNNLVLKLAIPNSFHVKGSLKAHIGHSYQPSPIYTALFIPKFREKKCASCIETQINCRLS